jgi:hypothetical protein
MIVADILYRGLRLAGILSVPQRQPSGSEVADAMLALNSMIDAMLNEKLLVWGDIGASFDIVANKVSYSIGIGGDFNVPRPEQILQAEFTYTNLNPPVQQQFRILTDQEWEALSPKPTQTTPMHPSNLGFQSTIPYYLYYRRDVPLGTVFLWPCPLTNSQVGTITIYLWQQIQQFATPGTAVILPPGYQAMLEYNLAVELAVIFPERARIHPMTIQLATEKKAWVKTINHPPLKGVVELAARGINGRGQSSYSILSNSYTPTSP